MKFNLERILSKFKSKLFCTFLGVNLLLFPIYSFAHKDLELKNGHYILDVYADYFPPYQNIINNNFRSKKHLGLVIDILRELDKHINPNFNFHHNIPRKRALDEIIHVAGKGEILASGVKTKKREDKVKYSIIPISKITWKVYSLPETKTPFSQAETLILPLGYAAPEELTKGKRILSPNSEIGAIGMLDVGRAEYTLLPEESFNELKKGSRAIPLPSIKIEQDLYILYNKNLPEKVINEMDETLIRLVHAGVIRGINAKYGINYSNPKLPK